MPNVTRAALETELAQQVAACDAALSSKLEALSRIAALRAEIKGKQAAIAGFNDVLRECRVRIKQIKRAIRAAERST